MIAIPRTTAAAATTAHTARPTHTHACAKSVIQPAPAAAPTVKVEAAYMPTGKTVAQRAAEN
jgi:hypothetical protein